MLAEHYIGNDNRIKYLAVEFFRKIGTKRIQK